MAKTRRSTRLEEKSGGGSSSNSEKEGKSVPVTVTATVAVKTVRTVVRIKRKSKKSGPLALESGSDVNAESATTTLSSGGSSSSRENNDSEMERDNNKSKGKRKSEMVLKTELLEEKRKRQRLSADQRTLIDANTILSTGGGGSVPMNPLSIDHVIENVFSFIFPGPEKDNFNLEDLCNFRLVSKAWNRAGTRFLKRHCRIGVGTSLESTDTDPSSNSSNAEHDIEEELTLPVLPITLNLSVEKIKEFTAVMKKSEDVPFVMFSLREGLFSEDNSKLFVELLEVCGPTMEQLLVTMEPSTCAMSFLMPILQFPKLKRLKLMMKHSKNDYTASAMRQFKVSDRIYPIDGINGIYLLQNLCNAATCLERLDIHWMPTLIPWSSTFGLKDIFLPKSITKLTLDTMNTDGTTVKNLLLHDGIRLTILKWSIGLPLQTLTADDVKQCLKKHSKSLRSLYFSIWISRLHHEGCKLVDFPAMPNVEQLSLMGDGGQITPFSFPKIFPKLSSLTLYHQMLDFLGEAIPSKTVKVVRILGAPIRGDVKNTLAKAFPELETLILFPQRDLHSKEYLVSMFDLMAKLRILLSHISRSDASTESTNNSVNKEEDLPNGLYMRSYRRSTYIVRIESGSTEVTRAVAEALEHLDSISRNPPFTLDAAAFSYL